MIPLTFWDAVTARLHPQGIRTLAYSAVGGPCDPVLFDRPLEELVDASYASTIHLVGTSMGALISLRYARSHRDRVETVTLCGPEGLSPQHNPVAKLPEPLAVLAGKYLLRRGLLRHLSHNVNTERDAERLLPLVLQGFQFRGSMYGLLSRLRSCPVADQEELFDATNTDLPRTMLLWGADDQVTPASGYDRAAELLRPVSGGRIDGCAHMVPFERLAVFADALQSFVRERVT